MNKSGSLNHFLKEYLRYRPIFLSLVRAKEAQLYQEFLPLAQPVLDFGCGDGFFARTAFTQRIEVGLDVIDSRISEAKGSRVYEQTVIYDGQKIPFPDNFFARVVSNCVLEHLPRLDLSLAEIHRVLKPGGLFLTTVVSQNWEEYLLGNFILGRLYRRWMRKKQQHFNLFNPQGWQDKFKQHGFEVVKAIGYLDSRAVKLIDLLHYLSLSSLFSYKLLGCWVLWPGKVKFLPIHRWLTGAIHSDLPPKQAAMLFFALRK